MKTAVAALFLCAAFVTPNSAKASMYTLEQQKIICQGFARDSMKLAGNMREIATILSSLPYEELGEVFPDNGLKEEAIQGREDTIKSLQNFIQLQLALAAQARECAQRG